MFVLESERLSFRQMFASDLGDFAALQSDDETMRFLGGSRSLDQSWETLQRIRRSYHENQFGLYAITLKATGRFAGRCGFIAWNIEGRREVELAYLIARQEWGNGLATEAARSLLHYGFTRLKQQRLIALINPANTRSLRVAEKAGLKFEREVDINRKRVQLHTISSPANVGWTAEIDRCNFQKEFQRKPTFT